MIDFLALVIVVTAIQLINTATVHPSTAPVAQVQNPVASHQIAEQKSVEPALLPDTANTFASSPSWTQNYAGGTQFSGTIWNVEQGNNNGWGNNELETYGSGNVAVQNGALTITAMKNGSGYTSGRINTQNKFDFTYGKLDVVAALPTGKGVWPAIWLLPTDSKYSGQDSNWLANGEIDIVEGESLGDNRFSGSAHSLNHSSGNSPRSGTVSVGSPGSFHTYSLEWTPSSLNYLVDGKSFYTVANSGGGYRDWPYDQRFHLIMNVAVGGDESGGAVDANAFPAQMKVRSISYYPYSGK